MRYDTPHKYSLYYSELASRLCHAIDALRRAKTSEELDAAILDYERARTSPVYNEFEKWVCERSGEIRAIRAIPFHLRPDMEECPFLDWSPALYALYCVCGEIVDCLLPPRHSEELPHALRNFDGAAMAVECGHELIHLHERDQAARRDPQPDMQVLPLANQPAMFLSAADIARLLRQPVSRIESFLRRYRADHPDCFVEVDNPRRNEPRYLYRTADVADALR